MAGVPLGNVESSSFLQGLLRESNTPNGELGFETYAGSVAIGLHDSSGHIVRKEHAVFLPMEGTTIGLYPDAEILQTAVMVAPGGFTGTDDEENVVSIDAFDLRLEPQSFPSVGGNPQCLVLYFTAAVLNGTLHRVSYNVSWTWRLQPKADIADVGPGAVPA